MEKASRSAGLLNLGCGGVQLAVLAAVERGGIAGLEQPNKRIEWRTQLRCLMPLPEAYTTIPGNIPKLLDAIQAAGVPPRVTVEFLKTLGFKSSNDRNLIGSSRPSTSSMTTAFRPPDIASSATGARAQACSPTHFVLHTRICSLLTPRRKNLRPTHSRASSPRRPRRVTASSPR